MKVAVFGTKKYDRQFLDEANAQVGHEFYYFEPMLTQQTAKLAHGFECICSFVNDHVDRVTLQLLHEHGVRFIVLRCAGFNHIDVKAAEEFGIQIARVPAYSPHGVAEHAVALILALNRKIHRAHNRVHEGNFSIDGLLGFDIYGKTIGVVGTGKIGQIFAHIMNGFGAKLLAYDKFENDQVKSLGAQYVDLKTLYGQSDIVSLHLPLLPETHHIINKEAVDQMKPGVMLINISRGELVDTQAVIDGLKSAKIGYLGLDVYEEEEDLFFEDLSGNVLQDDVFARLLTFSNVIITSHQAFFTENALHNIAETTIENITGFERNTIKPLNLVTSELLR